MPNYKEGLNRHQQLLFPPSLDEYVDEDNSVRAIDSYVDSIDLATLGVFTSSGSSDGQPAYHPALLLKIYLYGYLNSIRSSRKLERELKRNVEMMWLCAGLTPGYKTIANFRKDNPKVLKQLFRDFVMLCRSVDLIDGEVVAIDGAFLRANASKNQLISETMTRKDIESVDEKIAEYLSSLEYSDSCEKKEIAPVVHKQHLDRLKKYKSKLNSNLHTLKERNVTQYCKSDPDATLMRKPAHHLMAYNAQIAVDGKHKFIVATDISTKGVDLDQLYPLSTQAKEATGNKHIKVVADAGYYNPKEIKRCVDEGIDVYVPIQDKQKKQVDRGKFPRDAFHYDEANDCYHCPNNKVLKRKKTIYENKGIKRFMYFGTHSVCKVCPLRSECLPEKTPAKRLWRWEHEALIVEHRTKMQTPEARTMIKQRAALAEHPFGTIKQNLGWSHFLMRGKTKVAGENALIMLTYNFRRLLNLIGIALFQKLMKALKSGNLESIKQEIAEYLAVLYFFRTFFRQKMSFSA
ncbi:IS1182 family transposase [Candidatus Sulfurimonas baltica]|uniref:IS1182 family transposase n=1 Tax=Candidatus Sulfurimonas baltica TaxID=2740404 RepID=A0A7S7LXA0_9BACT|nr:IS1182 family transposase [Candidatus Sulfurimonas baltica]QOY53146.1 IS1182 family transposase [Candidatus Sulfurimonas baltica]